MPPPGPGGRRRASRGPWIPAPPWPPNGRTFPAWGSVDGRIQEELRSCPRPRIQGARAWAAGMGKAVLSDEVFPGSGVQVPKGCSGRSPASRAFALEANPFRARRSKSAII